MCIWKCCSIWKDWDKDKCFEKIGIRGFIKKKKKIKTTLPLTHVFKTTLIIKTKPTVSWKNLKKKKKKPYLYLTVTYINNSIQKRKNLIQ